MKHSKLMVFEHILLDGSCDVHFDGRKAGVEIPTWLRRDPHVVLRFGYGEDSTYDVAYTAEAVSAFLRFSGEVLPCCVPWSAVFALKRYDGWAQYWTEDIPEEALAEAPTAKRSKLSVVRGGGQTGPSVERRLRLV